MYRKHNAFDAMLLTHNILDAPQARTSRGSSRGSRTMMVHGPPRDASRRPAYNDPWQNPDPGRPAMLDPKHLDDLTRRLSGSLPKGLQALQEDINRNLRAALEAGLSRLDLVTREELEVQAAVLARTREKLERLEAEMAALEQQMKRGTATGKKKTGARKTSVKKSS
jgi:hypothetical protein